MLKQFLQEFNLLQLKVVKPQEISRARLGKDKVMNKEHTQPAFNCSKPTMETPEQYVKYVNSSDPNPR